MTSTRQLPDGPRPVAAEWEFITKIGRVRFDKRLQPTSIANTLFLFEGLGIGFTKSRFLINGHLIDPWTIEGPTVPWIAFTVPPPRLDYLPPPFDVIGFDDSIAPAFANFPVTKLP